MRTQEEEWLLWEKYNGIESDAYRADVERFAKGEPVAYVIGFSTFLGCKIDLSLRPLIPRPETEYWTEIAIEKIKAQFGANETIHCLDIFSGSGCIGIAVLSRIPNARVDFADIDPAAIEQIKINLELNNIDPSRYKIFLSDVFQNIPAGKKYEAILSNPPYIAHSDRDKVGQSVLDHEPHTALFAEDNGLELVTKTLTQSKEHLVLGGHVFVEHDDFQKEAIEEMFKVHDIYGYTFNKDQFGVWRWIELSA